MKKYITLIISIINAAAMALFINTLPDKLYPAHWGPNLEPDRYGSKWEMLIFPAVCILLSIGFIVYRNLTKNNERIQKNAKYENIFIPSVIILFVAIGWIIALCIAEVIVITASAFPLIGIGVGILMILMSNIMGKLKQNRHFGLKTPATLKNEVVWKKAHRLCGLLGVIAGFITIITSIAGFFLAELQPYLLLCSIILFVVLGCFIPSVYASRLYAKIKKAETEDIVETDK